MSVNLLCLLIFIKLLLCSAHQHHITERSLLFPQYTVLQFTYGVSAPVILPNRTFQLSLCVQQNYELPYNTSNFMITTYGRKQSDEAIDIERHTFYEYVIEFIDSFGFAGEECLLRAICEISEIPMYREDDNTLLENILHYVLTPSLDDPNETNEEMKAFYAKIIEAENVGKSTGNCLKQYESCQLSIIDLFTTKITQFL